MVAFRYSVILAKRLGKLFIQPHAVRVPMPQLHDDFEIGNRPEGISSLPRDSEHGQVVEEVGVYQQGSGKDYWKTIQRIEEEGWESHLRFGYYSNDGDDWSWSPRPLMLPPRILNSLYAQAITEGVLSGDELDTSER